MDLTARHHGLCYAQPLFKILPLNTKPINIIQLFGKIPVLGRIHDKENGCLVTKVLYTEWISKGKAGVPVELVLKVRILEDQYGFTLNHRVMQDETDDQMLG